MTDLNLERSVHSVAGGMVYIKPIFNFLSQIINNSLFIKTAFLNAVFMNNELFIIVYYCL